MDEKIEQLRVWCLEEFYRRTNAIEDGSATMAEQIDWAIPSYRVRFSEAWAKAEELGIDMSIPELRLALEGCMSII